MELIHQRAGLYLAQVKANQKVLLEDCELIHRHLGANHHSHQCQKGHGRVETRRAWGYELDAASLEERWEGSGIRSLLVIERLRYQIKTRKQSSETAYWVSNQVLDSQSFDELIEAIRGHWAVEVHHHIRDVQMGEDRMITRNPREARVMAGFITTATNMLMSQGQNLAELRERLTRNQELVDPLFKRKNVL